MITKESIAARYQELQDHICQALESLEEGSKFKEDLWNREQGGGGRTRVLQQNVTIEKGGVNFSAVSGPLPEKISNALKLGQEDFFATGVSIVIHPFSPHVPIIHMNVRFFELQSGHCWFGGGIDLTPHYVDKQQAGIFHQALKNVCDKYNKSYYPEFKTWADDYFYLPHRNETRGVGGIFFDRKSPQNEDEKQHFFDFTCDLCLCFAEIYPALVKLNKGKKVTEAQLDWQALRRSRYVEFNLLFDKGTKFGIDTAGRTESILMSMPPMAKWEYNHNPLANSEEEKTIQLLKKNIDWLATS